MIMAYLPSWQSEVLKEVASSAARFLIFYSSSFADFGKIHNWIESLTWLELIL